MTTKTVYKVVRKSVRGRRYSAIVRNFEARIHYRLRTTIPSPDGRPPLAFKTKDQAYTFASNHREQIEQHDAHPLGQPGFRLEVWECKATGVKPLARVTCNWSSFQGIKEFWQEFHEQEQSPTVASGMWERGNTPPGTVTCQTIRLVRKVA